MSCSSAATPAPGELPAHKDLGGQSPVALQRGTLVVVHGSCVSLADQVSGATWLVIWPLGYSLHDEAIEDSTGQEVARLGVPLAIGGGSYSDQDIRELLATPIADTCRTNQYWLAVSIAPS